MTTIRDMPLDCPEATYVEPVYKEAGMRNFTNLVRTCLLYTSDAADEL